MNNLNLAKEVREQKLREGQEIGKLVLLAEARLGELFNRMPKATTNHKRQDLEIPSAGKFSSNESEEEESEEEEEEEPPPKPKLVVAAEMGFNKNQAAQGSPPLRRARRPRSGIPLHDTGY